MGLNPPFGLKAILANKFINKALTFKPKLIEYYTKVPGIGALPFVLAPRGPGIVHRANVYCFKWGHVGPGYCSLGPHALFKWARILFKWAPRIKIYLIIFFKK